MPRRRFDASTLNDLLADRIGQLAAELLPSGRRVGHEWVAPSPTGTSARSMSVRLTGAKAGVWSDFSAGVGGKPLSLVATLLFQNNFKQACEWAVKWLGLQGGKSIVSATAEKNAHVAPPDTDDREAENRKRAALGMFLGATELGRSPENPVLQYLDARGIRLTELRRFPASLRYAAALYNSEMRMELPGMVAGVRGPDGAMIAVHRTWLEKRAGVWRKASLTNPKMTLGAYAGGCVPLWRGASCKPLADAPQGEMVAIGEGIETCLSVVIACPHLRVLAALNLSNLGRIILPPQIGTVILLRDDDLNNAAAGAAFDRAIAHYQSGGFLVRVADPPAGCKDFNESLTEE